MHRLTSRRQRLGQGESSASRSSTRPRARVSEAWTLPQSPTLRDTAHRHSSRAVPESVRPSSRTQRSFSVPASLLHAQDHIAGELWAGELLVSEVQQRRTIGARLASSMAAVASRFRFHASGRLRSRRRQARELSTREEVADAPHLQRAGPTLLDPFTRSLRQKPFPATQTTEWKYHFAKIQQLHPPTNDLPGLGNLLEFEDTCAICCDEFQQNEGAPMLQPLACGHVFHHGCLSEWFESQWAKHGFASCPMCRSSVLSNKAAGLCCQ
jgi:hypothetical protein